MCIVHPGAHRMVYMPTAPTRARRKRTQATIDCADKGLEKGQAQALRRRPRVSALVCSARGSHTAKDTCASCTELLALHAPPLPHGSSAWTWRPTS
jgi:hypothetical protein